MGGAGGLGLGLHELLRGARGGHGFLEVGEAREGGGLVLSLDAGEGAIETRGAGIGRGV